jgi:uncharacterized membrane protein/nitrite reductase/ring-hydroxylating ferredoxin subunit
MKSTAHIKGHPIHPMLVPFPIAFFIGALLFDLLALLFEKDGFAQTAGYLIMAGIIAALITAIPGFIDYLYTVPPKSTGKTRAAKHGLLNLSIVALFLFVWLYRQQENVSMLVVILFELIGAVLLTVSGWMGGTLVYRNQIGVNPRTARAGKWKEIYLDGPAEGLVEVKGIDDLKLDQMRLIHIGGKRITIASSENGFVAFDDRCSHRGGSLAGGMMICGTVQCPWHGSQFDVCNGEVKAGPATEKIPVYKLKELNSKIFLDFS